MLLARRRRTILETQSKRVSSRVEVRRTKEKTSASFVERTTTRKRSALNS